ncbi:MAG: histidine-type phosphatase [Bacteroidales bacterium]|nr:histidine-type phosphatase [Bacteroidales bacterium]MBR1795620.1 histidine-type phosphatase [Bacteroidales bacterium]
MRKTAFLLLVLASLAASAQPKQSPEMVRFLRENPHRAAFNTHSYEFNPIYDTPAPKGYKPFYITHYGRHGSRSSWGGSAYAHVRDILAAAKEADLLTPAGDSLMREAAFVYDSYDGMDGRLTPRGADEHATIAERMYRRYPAVFRKGSRKVRAVSSTVPRCIVSMTAFTARLSALQPSLDISWDTGEKFMEYIAKADDDAVRKQGKALRDSVWHSYTVDTVTVMRNLFTDPAAARRFVPDIVRFEKDIFETAAIADAFDIEDNMFRYLPFDLVYQLHERKILDAYLGQCNSVEFGDRRMPRAGDLARVLIRQADEAIAGGPRAADLCFGHDWPYLGLVSWFGLEGVGDRMDLEEARARWFGARYCPFAANLQIIFYRNKADDILVKFLVNEEETLIPVLTPVSGPYYRWDDVKAMHPEVL